MTNYLHTDFSVINDADFQRMIDELHHCIGWCRDDRQLSNAFYLLSVISAQDFKALSAAHLPAPGILTMKVGKLPQGAVYDFCCELVRLVPTHIEAFDGKTVLSLIKTYFRHQKPSRPRKPSRGEARHQRMTNLILQRRANGTL